MSLGTEIQVLAVYTSEKCSKKQDKQESFLVEGQTARSAKDLWGDSNMSAWWGVPMWQEFPKCPRGRAGDSGHMGTALPPNRLTEYITFLQITYADGKDTKHVCMVCANASHNFKHI